jgi:hypothetical protein
MNMSFADVHNGGAYARSARGSGNNAVTAGGAGDATEVNAAWQSRKGASGIALSVKTIVSFTATLAQGATLAFGGNYQDASDGAGAGAADYGDVIAEKVVATGKTGGSTETGTFELDCDLAGAREFIRAQVTPNLSAANTDTAAWHIDYVFFGDQRGPTTKSAVNIGSADAI